MSWNPPSELLEYLTTLIKPPIEGAEILYIADLDQTDWAKIQSAPQNIFFGVIARGTPTEKQAEDLLRVLRPGAHLLLIAPDTEPWGITGACRLEDSGFEIRDAIAVAIPLEELAELPSASDPLTHPFHYAAKASRKEREFGCPGVVEPLMGHEVVGREEGSAGMANPRAGAGRTNNEIYNDHVTVKPIKIMTQLLHDVPKRKGPVLDPFMGSGTTGIACAQTGHDFLGIEKELRYTQIATARIRAWAALEPQLYLVDSDQDNEAKRKEWLEKELADTFGWED